MMGRNGQALMAGLLSFKDDVASHLMDPPIVPMSAQNLDQIEA
jgi:hypothetical protein